MPDYQIDPIKPTIVDKDNIIEVESNQEQLVDGLRKFNAAQERRSVQNIQKKPTIPKVPKG